MTPDGGLGLWTSVTADDDLVAQAVAGDPDAFAILVERYYADCWRFARRILGNEADAEDAVHDTFLRAQRALVRFRPQERFKAWLFRILTNRCRTLVRTRRRREHWFPAGDETIAVTAARDAAAPADARLADALARLDPDQREALLMKYGEDMEYEEMASILGVGVSALKMRVSRARAAMRAMLGDRAAYD